MLRSPFLMSISYLLSFGHIHTYRLRKIVYSNEKIKWCRTNGTEEKSIQSRLTICSIVYCFAVEYVLTCLMFVHFSIEKKGNFQNRTKYCCCCCCCRFVAWYASFFFQLFSTDEYIESLKENADKSKVSFFKQFHILFCNNSSICFWNIRISISLCECVCVAVSDIKNNMTLLLICGI